MNFTLIMLFSDMCHFCEDFLNKKYNKLCKILSENNISNIFTLFIKSSHDIILKQINLDLANMVKKIGAVPLFILIPTEKIFNVEQKKFVNEDTKNTSSPKSVPCSEYECICRQCSSKTKKESTPIPYGWILFDEKYEQISNIKYDVDSIVKWVNKMKNMLSKSEINQTNKNINILPYNV